MLKRLRCAAALVLWCAGVGAAASAQPAAAEDAVYLKPRAPGGPLVRLRGEVLDYTGRELRMMGPTGAERRIPAVEVQRVDTSLAPEHASADRLFQTADFGRAAAHYRLALQASHEKRPWVRRQILAQLVWCHRNLEEGDRAGEYFLQLLESDPETRHFDSLPLVWDDATPAAEVERKASLWLVDEARPAAMLMGASQLLTTAQRPQALKTLQLLLADPDPRIAWLAFGQLWRAGSNNATAEQRQSFARRIEQSDPALRAGAYYTLGQTLRQESPEDAAIALLRLPISYPREHKLAARALLDAGQCLERLQRPQQARSLYRELAEGYTLPAEVAEAHRRLERLATRTAAGKNGP